MSIETSSTSSSSVAMSSRISFSRDFPQTDGVPIESNSSSSTTVDFDFCVFRESFDHESSSADELFFDGKILPIEIKKKLGEPPKKKPDPPAPPPYSSLPDSNARKISKIQSPIEKRTKVYESDVRQNPNPVPGSEEKQNSSSKSWFKRSSSLHCGSSYARSLCPLPLLSRSNSTGSTTNVKKQQNLHKSSSSSSSSSSGHYYQKPPLKKSYSSTYGNNGGGLRVKINPVLNVPTPTLFGLASIFSNSKGKNKNK